MSLELKKYICKIVCNEEEKGTGFLVNQNTIITAAHVTENCDNIIAQFLEISNSVVDRKCTRISEECDYDVEILKLDKEVDLYEFIEISTEYIPVGKQWNSYGYPDENSPQGSSIGGIIINANDKVNPCDYNIDIDVQIGKMNNYSGLSGAPLLIDDKIQGILLHQNGEILKVIEFSRVKEFMEKQCIVFSDDEQHNISNVKLIDTEIMINYNLTSKLNNIIDNKNGEIVLLQGSVGIGKSTFVQYYKGTNGTSVLGKYFIKIPNDMMPLSYRISSEVFYEWIIERISSYLRIRVEDTEKLSYSKKLQYLGKLSKELSSRLVSENKKAVFFLDGIDELSITTQEEIEKIISYITILNNKNMFFIITSNNYERLPESLLQKVDLQNNVLRFKLYDIKQIKYYLYKVLNKKLSENQLEDISKKSMGHPLYLKYIIKYLNVEEEVDLDNYINELPSYSGDIKTYYEFLWRKISLNPNKIYIVAYLARIRAAIRKDIFRNLLPNEVKLNLESTFNELKYLFLDNVDNIMAFFHSSFADFINDKTDYMNNEIHHSIGKYCLENSDNDFSVTNILYHLSNGEKEDIKKCIEECNQDLVDRCTVLNITPDLLIYDVKKVLKLSCENGDYVSVIRILLLLERVDFRYNQMFISFAFEIAKAEISFNRPDKAMQYIIRQDNIIISIDQILYCLFMLVERNYSEQAEIIIMKLESLFFQYIENKKGIPTDFTVALLQAYNIYADLDGDFAANRYLHVIKIIRNSSIGENQEILNYIISSSSAYELWRKGEYFSIDSAKKKALDINENTLNLYILLLDNALDMERIFNRKYVKSYKNIAQDIERMIVSGLRLEDKQLAIEGLIKEGNDFQLVKKLIEECSYYKNDTDFREDNGVDLSIRKFNSFFGYYRNKGYISENEIETIDINIGMFKSNWEEGIKSFTKIVALVYGNGLYCKAVDNYTSTDKYYKYLKGVLENKIFDLDLRMKFAHSYNIPEDIFTILFSYITEYIAEFKNDKIEEYLQYIEKKSLNQFGLYSEGYIYTLFAIVNTMLKYNIDSLYIKRVIDLIFKEVKDKVMNRWERTPYLLDIVELYNLIDCNEVARDVYNEMLKTSMGPTWYKEAQLSLLSEGLKPIESQYITNNLIKRNFVLLDSATGGMTFERYIRVEKEKLIGELWRKGLYNISFNYLKSQVYPNIDSLECNIKIENVDANEYGLKSYRIANSIFLDSVILDILINVKSEEKALVWCFAEIFMFGDERNLSDYISIQCEIVNELNRISSNNLNKYINRIITILTCDCDEDKRYQFIKMYKQYLDEFIYECMINKLSKILNQDIDSIIDESNNIKSTYNNDIDYKNESDINSNVNNKKNIQSDKDLYLEGVFGKLSVFEECKDIIDKGDKEILKGNSKNAINKYIEVLLKIHKNGWDIWQENSDEQCKECFHKIIQECKDKEEVVKVLEPVIVNDNYCASWNIANRLYNITSSRCSSEEKNNVISEMFSHLETIVNPNNIYSEKYNNLDKWREVSEESKVLLELFLWLGWYPDPFISQKVFDLLPWLIEISGKYLNDILSFCFYEDINISESCVTLCLYLSNCKNNELWKLISNYDILGKIINSRTFIVKSSFLQVYKNYISLYPESSIYVETIERYFNSESIDSGNITMNGYNYKDFMQKIDRKNIINKLLNKDKGIGDLRGILFNCIKSEIEPRSIEEFYKLDQALCKSYRRKSIYFGYAHDLFYKYLNYVLTSLVPIEKSELIANCIRRINPYFPLQRVESHTCYLKKEKLKNLLYIDDMSKVDEAIKDSLYDEDNILLYYINYEYDNKLYDINVISYVVDKKDSIEKYSKDIAKCKKLYSNEYRDVRGHKNEISTVISIEPTLVKGRSIGEALLNEQFVKEISASNSDFKLDKWSSDRVWNNSCGLPCNEGCKVTVKKRLINNIYKDKKLIYNVFDSNKSIIIDIDSHQIIGIDRF